MEHQHIYDAQGKKICCTEEEKIYTNAGAEELLKKNKSPNDTEKDHHNHDHGDHDEHDHDTVEGSKLKIFFPSIISFTLLMVALYFDYLLKPDWFKDLIRIGWYAIAYLPVGLPVLKEAFVSIKQGAFFLRVFSDGNCHGWCFWNWRIPRRGRGNVILFCGRSFSNHRSISSESKY